MNTLRNWYYDQKGQSTVEYLLVIGVVVVAVVGAGAMFANQISGFFQDVINAIKGAITKQ